MLSQSNVQFETFVIDVQFFSGTDHYATQSYSIDAVNWYSAQREALERSIDSVFDNPRIPELSRRAIAR